MTRRDLIRVVGLTAAPAIRNPAEPAVQPGPETNYREYARCLPDAIRGFASAALKIRNQALESVKTSADIRARQRWVRETFWSVIGGKRERTPPQARVTGRFERDRYTVEKLMYEGRPGEWISANLYLPKTGTAPYPAVLFQAGHTKNGKAGRTYQSCCQGLVQFGFVVLTFDPIGQGERTNYPGPDGFTRFGSADDEHTVPGRQLLLVGETMTRLQLEDAMKSLDVLASHPQVDASRLAAAGQSGGGTLTMMLAAVDDRLRAAVVCSGNTENVACENFEPPGSIDDAEQDFIGSGPLGFDRWDLLWPFAPRPLQILTSSKDFFGTYSPNYIRNARQEFRRLQEAYAVLGQAEQLRYSESPLPHALSYPLRLELYRWLRKWLQHGEQQIREEPPVAPEPDHQLWATASGSVVRELGSATPFALASARARQIQTPKEAPDLRKLLGITPIANPPRLNVLSTVPSVTCRIVAAEVPAAPNVWIPLWIFVPLVPAQKIIMMLDPNGRNARWQEGDLYQTLAEKAIVCVPDLRGIGDLRPEFSRGDPEYASTHQSDEAYGWASLIFGRPLLGQRVQDLLAVIDAVRDHFGNLPIALLAAYGFMTIPALCAASLKSQITQLYLSEHLVSCRNIAEQEDYNHPFSNFVPGVLAHTDLPNLATSISPRRITIAGAVNASGEQMQVERVREIYSSGNMLIRQAEKFEADALLSLL